MKGIQLQVGAVLAVALLASAPARADYAQPGTVAYSKTSGSVSVSNTAYAYDVYAPNSGGPYPIVGLAHGFTGSKTDLEGYGKLLASRGNVAVLPQFPLSPAQAQNAVALLAAMDDVLSKSGPGGAYAGKVDVTRQGVVGHSAGGLSAFLATAQRTGLKAAVLLDPVEANGLGVPEGSKVRTPSLYLLAEPATCNANGNATDLFNAVTGAPKVRMKLVGTTHCDVEDPINTICSIGCPGSSQARAAKYQRYAIAWLQYFLQCETAARAQIDGADFQADKTANAVSEEQFVGLPSAPCAVADAGAGGGAGGGSGGGSAGGGAGGGAAGGGAGGGAAGGGAGGGAAGGAGGGAAGGGAGGGASGGGAGGGAAGGGAGGAGGGGDSGAGCGCGAGGGVSLVGAWLAWALVRRRARRSA